MPLPKTQRVWLSLLLVAWLAAPAAAAEIRIRSQCRIANSIVRLGDVAEVFAVTEEEAQPLRDVELMPTPAVGSQTFLRAREIQDALILRGLNITKHRFSGASQVVVRPVEQPIERAAVVPGQRPKRVDLKAARREAILAVLAHLRSNASESEPWEVELDLTEAQLGHLATSEGGMTARGGTAPWTGAQRFELRYATQAGRFALPVKAKVKLPELVVVASRSLARGALVHASDVELRRNERAGRPGGPAGAFHAVEDVIGKETTRAIAPGQVVADGYVRRPLMVQRGDVVTVYARTGGVQVRTTARAREQGSLGDLIQVESLNRKRDEYLARVTGIQEVEVAVQSVAAGPPAAAARVTDLRASRSRTDGARGRRRPPTRPIIIRNQTIERQGEASQ